MKVALIPGHSSRSSGATVCAGALAGWSEFKLAAFYLPSIASRLSLHGLSTVITTRDIAGGSTPTYSALAANATDADIALELHFNSASNAAATGSEVLYWGKSAQGYRFAELLSANLAAVLNVKNRGALGVPTPDNRGTEAFRKSRMPFFMLEPCFAGSNPQDAAAYADSLTHRDKLDTFAHAIATTIKEIYA